MIEAMQPLQDLDDPDFDPTAAATMFSDYAGDPFSEIRAAIARDGPVQEGSLHSVITPGETFHDPERRHFVALGSAEAKAVLGNAEVYSQESYAEDVRKTFGKALNQMNPPEHVRYRRVLQKLFLPHIVAKWSSTFVEPVIADILGELKRSPKAELVRQFTHRYPFEIIFRQLDLPSGDIAIFQKLSESLSLRTPDMKVPTEASRKLGIYLTQLVEQRRSRPGNDVISQLIQTEVDGDRLPEDVLVSFFRQLLNAAGDTTYRATGNLLVGLLRDRPDQYRMLVKDKTLIPLAVEEVMRWNPPIIAVHRMATQDTELGGVHIPAGSYVQVNYSAVGHDETLHQNPDEFDMMRPDARRHTSFGFGIHICIGQHLARLEMTRALDALTTSFPNLRLDQDFPPPQIMQFGMRTPAEIRVLLH